MDDKIVIKRYENSYEANIDHRKLADQNIESWIMNKQDSAYVMLGEIELYVNSGDLEKANEILK